jgi:hypothetical protein
LERFVQNGLIDWGNEEDLKRKLLDILEFVRTGVLSLEELQARLDES